MRKNDDRIAIYSRKSKFTGKGESIGNQVELCKAYIRTHYGDAAADKVLVFEDEGFTGGNLNRPDFKTMMSAAKKRMFHTIVVYRLDRISRNISDFTNLIEELARLDIAFVSINEQFDTGSPMGRAMMYIASVFSQLERETIAERIRDNMRELAKTGRWLGGNTPTGYGSESVSNVTMDGKTRKACKLKIIPEEAEIVKTIFDLYTETDSLTATEAEMLRRRIKTKRGNDFTRFAIKGILNNPVYMIANEDAYDYLVEKEVELFSSLADFDGEHGLMVYNRTDQEKGKTMTFLPTTEWIVAVGKHPGLIPARQWISVQNSLERNKSKAYRKPRNNEALLTGILFCSCGGRMYPKLSKRLNEDGNPIYTYVCKMKERSQKSICNRKNINGNALDLAIAEQIKLLEDSPGAFIAQLEQSRKYYTGNRTQYEDELISLRQEKAEIQKKIDALVDTLTELGDSSAKSHVAKRIEQYHQNIEGIGIRIRELEGLMSQQALSASEFDVLRQLLSVFRNGFDEMTVEQKRTAIRTIVRKIIWDGKNVHMVLFGADEGDIEYSDTPAFPGIPEDEYDGDDIHDAFSDAAYGAASGTPW